MKICIIGNPDELKTEFIQRFTEGKFTSGPSPTPGVDFTSKKIKVDNNNIKLILVDTAGHEFFRKLRPSYYRGASALIITYDKGDKPSFERVKEWYREFRKYRSDKSIPITLLGFITDSEVITTEEGKKLAEELETNYFELKERSSELEEIEEVFRDITRRALETKDKR